MTVRPAHSLLIVVLGLAFSGWAGADGDWESYKSRFLQPEGRIADTGRGGISHSEGQAFGMLLAVGSRPSRIIRMVLIESVILGFIGVAIGSVLGTAVVLITGHTGIDYAALGGASGESVGYAGLSISYIIYPKFELRHMLYGLSAVTFTSVLASLWPASLAARMEPIKALRS